MKKLIIALVFGIGLTGFAQEVTPQTNRADMEKMTPEQRQQKYLQKLTKELTLDAKQQEAVGKILAEKSAKAQDLKVQKDSRKASGDKMTAEERTAFKNTMQAEKADTEAKMKAVLSADQYQKWLDMREENKDKMKDKMSERRNGGM
jgi:protein CpxP